MSFMPSFRHKDSFVKAQTGITVEKFFFDQNKFDEPEKPKEPEAPPPPTFSEEELEQAKHEAHQRGLQEGLQQGKEEAFQSIDQEISQKISALSVKVEALNDQEEARRRLFEREAVSLVLTVCEKLLPEFKKISQGKDLGDFVLSKIAQESEPEKLAIRIHPDQSERLQEIIKEKIPNVELTVKGDPSLDVDDAVITWADGGVQRKVAQVQAQVMRALQEELARFDDSYGTKTKDKAEGEKPSQESGAAQQKEASNVDKPDDLDHEEKS